MNTVCPTTASVPAVRTGLHGGIGAASNTYRGLTTISGFGIDLWVGLSLNFTRISF